MAHLHSLHKGANKRQPVRAIPPFPGPAAAGPPADPAVVFQGPLARAGDPSTRERIDVTTMSSAEPTRRDFLYIATASLGAVGAAATVWPLVAQMNPDASTIAAGAPIDVDLGPITEGQVVKVFWRSKPIFIGHRSKKEIEEAQKVDIASLPDPQADGKRVKEGHDQW